MRNWLGQLLVEGAPVYRGARQGNSSEFKVGVIQKLHEDKGKVTVKWLWECGYHWVQGSHLPNVPQKAGWGENASVGTCAKDSVVVLDEKTFARTYDISLLVERAKQEKWPVERLNDAIERYNNTP